MQTDSIVKFLPLKTRKSQYNYHKINDIKTPENVFFDNAKRITIIDSRVIHILLWV